MATRQTSSAGLLLKEVNIDRRGVDLIALLAQNLAGEKNS